MQIVDARDPLPIAFYPIGSGSPVCVARLRGRARGHIGNPLEELLLGSRVRKGRQASAIKLRSTICTLPADGSIGIELLGRCESASQ